MLKVFLIDRAGDVREIYSSLFLHPQSVLNDIETLLMEEGLRVGAPVGNKKINLSSFTKSPKIKMG
ncbi:MAG TPA: hypothetical protein VNT76_24290, partial [Candidatus Binatus sp.]|nr:hypothetical protein [Candidatus Binatus sp.]